MLPSKRATLAAAPPTWTLVHGAELLSEKLRLALTPLAGVFRFRAASGGPTRTDPVRTGALVCLVISFLLTSMNHLAPNVHFEAIVSRAPALNAAAGSAFVRALLKLSGPIVVAIYLLILTVALWQRSTLIKVLATKHKLVCKRDQRHLARVSFLIFLTKTLCSALVASTLISQIELAIGWRLAMMFYFITVEYIVLLTVYVPLMFACYAGQVLAKHVAKFASTNIDTLFDRFDSCLLVDRAMYEADMADSSYEPALNGSHSSNDDDDDDDDGDDLHSKHARSGHASEDLDDREPSAWRMLAAFVRRVWAALGRRLAELARHLNVRQYPELPEMKMTRLAAVAVTEIGERARHVNNQLIRARLRKTQLMLGELRDTVTDINRTSSPVLLLVVLFETFAIVLVATLSIQAKAYESVSLLVVPPIMLASLLAFGVVYICISLDQTPSQLKLMVNKMFDFIIMNNRGKRAAAAASSAAITSHDLNLSETWSQFQYTRKLASTIQFSLGGLAPVSRRLALSILGHLLSATFISIEIMNIVDSSTPSRHALAVAHNA